MKKINLFLLLSAFTLTIVFDSCKSKEKAEDAQEAVVMDEPTDEPTLVSITEVYPEETMASPVTPEATKVHIKKAKKGSKAKKGTTKSNSIDGTESTPTVDETPVPLTPNDGAVFVDDKDNVVGAVLVSTNEQDTVQLHVTDVEHEFIREKQTKHRIKGVAYVNNKKYTFNTPVKVTKTNGAVDVDGSVYLTPETTTTTPDGETTVDDQDNLSEPVEVTVRHHLDKVKVVKLKDLETGQREKLVYGKHGELKRDHISHKPKN